MHATARRVRVPIAAFTLPLLLTACTAVKVSSWTNPEFKDRALGEVMVIGVVESESTRRQYEEMFVAALNEIGVTAHTTSELIPSGKPVSKERLQTLMKESGAESVLVTRVIDEKDKINYTAPMAYPGHYMSPYGYYSHSFTYVHAPASTYSYVEVHLETNLYDAKTSELVWSGRKKITDSRSDKKNMTLVIKAIIKDLQKQQLL